MRTSACTSLNLKSTQQRKLIKQSRYKCWKVSGIFPWAALLFVVGYVLREYGAFHFGEINIFIASLVFIYCAP